MSKVTTELVAECRSAECRRAECRGAVILFCKRRVQTLFFSQSFPFFDLEIFFVGNFPFFDQEISLF